MKRLFLAVLIGLCMMALISCAHRQAVQSEQPQTTPAAKSETPGSSTGEGAGTPMKQAETKAAEKELGTKVEDIHFDFDKSDVREDAKPIMKSLAGMLSSSTATHVVIEGNCDERGTSEYNLALGDRRANAAKTYLISLGIPSARLKTISYGKEKPLCTEGTEECWAKNRRDHFVLTEGK
ncbi:MAG: peptidoglycan-associated lipoprotein Pal [Nitrospirae bacterium]|nr:peptidoglycan-associated lipoprotein Pal [Nitrospirota bacterium]